MSRAPEFGPLQPGVSVCATPHLSKTLNMDMVHVLVVLEGLPSWLAVCRDGDDELRHTRELSKPHADGDGTVSRTGETDRSVVSTLRL